MAGEIDESTALKHMVLHAGMDADEAYCLMDSWKYHKAVGSDDGYGKYSNLYDAVRTGTDLEGVIKTYTDNGIKPSTLTSQITEELKPEYVKLTPKERSAMRKKLVNAFVLCGMEQEDAEEKLDSWDFEAEHGFAYSDRKEAYENGEVSRSELVAILVGRGYSPEDANAQIDSYEWEAEGYEDVTYAAIRNYNTWCLLWLVDERMPFQIVDKNKNINVDRALGYLRIMAQKKKLEFTLPIFGYFAFGPEDIDKLKSLMED